jgi:transmembrane sensor
MTGSAQRDLDRTVLDAAADWRMRMDAPGWSASDEAALEAWLAADEAHERAFAHTGEVWDYFDEHAAAPEMMRARRDAIDRAHRTAGRRWSGPGRMLRLPAGRIAAGLAAAVVLAAGLYPVLDGSTAYQTGMGERRVVTLKDGSRLSLDGSTRVTVDYSRDARRLKLVRGQARFDVAKDVTRPFSVAARDRTVIATGTAFNIDMLEPEVRVTLIEGKVVILPRRTPALLARTPAGAKAIELHSGQQLVSAVDAAPTIAPANLAETTAWQAGKIIFDDEPLAEAVQRVNRYSNRKVVVEGAAARATRVSGVFEAGDTAAFVGAVTYYLPVKAAQRSDEIILTGDQGG